MKTSIALLPLAAVLGCLFIAVQPTLAQGTTFTYQGRVRSGGIDFNGTGQFKFALVTSINTSRQATAVPTISGNFLTVVTMTDGGAGYVSAPTVTVTGGGGSGAVLTANISGGAVTSISVNNPGGGYTGFPAIVIAPPPDSITYTTYWSNDSTSSAGSQPVAAVSVAVTNGLFTVRLGDTTLANMTALGAGLFAQPNLQLRIWFNDGVNGFAALSPVQNLTPAPYAIFANTASNLSGVLPASQLSGTITPTQLPASLVTNNATGLTLSGNFTGTGGGLTSLNASQLTGGTVADARLSANVALLNASQNFSGANAFTGPLVATNGNNRIAGNGAGLTNVNLALNSGGAITLSGGFMLSSSPGVALSPNAVTSVDVNGDGRPDLISANYNANSLTVLTNDGRGGFSLASSPNVGLGTISVVAVDVNGDGKVDLVSANTTDTLTVLTNNGTGGFVIASSPGVGSFPDSITAADVNGDGKVDLINANQLGGTLTVLTNNGSGGFLIASSPGVGSLPFSITAADVNGDGKPDLICANYNDNTLTVLTNNGGGGFVLASSPPVGLRPRSVVAVDVNGDGKVDLVAANSNDNTLTVLTNNGSGGFVLASSPAVGSLPFAVTAADVNGDGKPDLISANAGANTLTVLTNNGSGGFVLALSPGVGSFPVSVTSADVNGDGKVDLIGANSSDNTLSILINAPVFSGLSSGTFIGNGAGLTNLNAASLTGTLTATQIPGLDASKIAVGTLSDARLSANVPLLNASQTFTGVNRFNNLVGIGIAPQSTLHVNGTARIQGNDNWDVNNTEGDFRVGNDVQRFKIGVSISGSGTGDVWMRAQGGTARLFVKTPGGTTFYSNEGQTTGVSMAAGGGAWTTLSDRNTKENFSPVNTGEVLRKVASLPLSTWNYKSQDTGVRHLGPMAQDFKAAFGLGETDTGITTVDADGIALAAIQGLHEIVKEKDVKISVLEKQAGDLEKRLSQLEERMMAVLAGRN